MGLTVNLTVDFKELVSKLATINGKLDYDLPQIANFYGERVHDAAVEMIAANTGIRPADIDAALDVYRATPFDASYSVESDSDKLRYVKWVTAHDEKVCMICAPRDGVVYEQTEAEQLWPAHPNCRCSLEPIDLGSELVAAADPALRHALDAATADALQLFTEYWGA